jgi:phage terminase large subunit-like protein
MSEPMKTLEQWVYQQKLLHSGDPVLDWMMSNVVCHEDANQNIFPRKEFPENKIDGVVALIMAVGRAMLDDGNTSEIGLEFW